MERSEELREAVEAAADATLRDAEMRTGWFTDMLGAVQANLGLASLVGDDDIAVSLVLAHLAVARACEADRPALAKIEASLIDWATAHPPSGPHLIP
jgi:hypothetical protein